MSRVANPSLAQLLANPAMVQVLLSDGYARRCVAGQVLTGRIDATSSGAAVIERAGLFTEPPESIPELGSYPIVGGGEEHQVVATDKWGLSTVISAEQVARNRVDVMRTRMVQMAAALARAVDTWAFEEIRHSTIPIMTGRPSWLSPDADPFRDVMLACASIEEQDLGVAADTVVCSPRLFAALVSASKVLEASPKDAADSAVLTGTIFSFGGLSILKTNRDFGADVLVCDSRMLGSLVFEWLGGSGWFATMTDPDSVETRVQPLDNVDGTRVSMRKVVAPVVAVPEAAIKLYLGPAPTASEGD